MIYPLANFMNCAIFKLVYYKCNFGISPIGEIPKVQNFTWFIHTNPKAVITEFESNKKRVANRKKKTSDFIAGLGS